jgi:maleylacetoacetate isomerase
MSTNTTLFDYWRSTASYRVRIALAMADIDYTSISVDLVKGEQREPQHHLRNPQGLVPVLDIDGQRFTQSLAIVEYLNQTRNLQLIPDDPVEAATVRALAYSLAVDVHPVCNLSVVAYACDGEEPQRTQWMQRFIAPGLAAFEQLLSSIDTQPCCFGQTATIAELCLIPQLYNARRWGVDYSQHSGINAIAEHCNTVPAFHKATPEAVKQAMT